MLENSAVQEIISDMLAERFAANGYQQSDVSFAEDFDGEQVIRVTAKFTQAIENSERLFEVAHEIQERLQQSGDDRFVFLRQTFPGDDEGSLEDEEPSRMTPR